jgi:hypothetical protein
VPVVLVAGSGLAARAEDDGPLTIADLPAYRAALEPTKPGDPPPEPATFRELWARPAESPGHRFEVGGRVERVFHQGPVGEFPALAEVWVVDSATDPLCLVFPDSPDRPAPKPGDSVKFAGTFLRRVRYRGGDADRLAPLIVGPGAPAVEARANPANPPGMQGSSVDGLLVAVLGGIVVLVLLRVHLRRPPTAPIVEEPPPEFQDGPPGE